LWAETYDRDLAEVFAVQDEVARRIAMTLVAHVNKSEIERVLRKPSDSMAAYDPYLRGRALLRVQRHEGRGGRIEAARALYEKALGIDGAFAAAHCALADTYVGAWLQPATGHAVAREFQQPETLSRAFAHANKAVELEGTYAEGHATLAWIMHWQHRRSESLAEFERAFALNPNLLDGRYRYGIALIHHGRKQQAIDLVSGVVRLDPFHSPFFESCLGMGHFLQGRDMEALELLRIATRRVRSFWIFDTWHAAAAARMGEAREAADAVAAARVVHPGLTVAKWLDFLRLADAEDVQRTAQALRRAGLPD
jgi:tetratricopeptide (TPR) repeat protein